ncbi:MAG: IPT/TIG domain-containing protein [Candidatus Sulfotelmatobacter sp.]
MKNSFVWTTRSLLLRLALALAIVLCCALLSRAGGPEYVAGTTYFTAAVPGQPLVWPRGQILYYTDQGDLSPLLPNATANTFVANAFSIWTSVPTAAIVATNSGELAEDVSGSNVLRNSDGSLTLPADIQPSATGTPVGVVYDYDGTVTDALLGSGAGAPSQCFEDGVFGGIDNFGASADFLHALVIINGQCAQQSSQLPDVEYRLVRVLGQILGLGWSQVNLNVITGNPPPTSADYAGFPVMHYKDATSCVPITRCYPNPYQLAMDDGASISRLYPITQQNQSTFPGKQVFTSATAGIHGTVWFTNMAGQPTQPMQGVNVVARWIDPSTGQPSRQYAASSVSGAFFTGNFGNPITGFYDPLGNLFSNWGSSTASMEGFFDISGLQIPNGATTALCELSVESLDPLWSTGVQPYGPFQVALSGQSALTVVNVTLGADVEQDILMAGSAQPVAPWAASQTWTVPAVLPAAADWTESLNGYGNDSYFSFSAQANRTLSVAVTALDENGNPTSVKVQPVIGMWAASDPEGTAPGAFTPSALNTSVLGLTRLDAQIFSPTQFLVGIADMRGDGRPDYRYHAHVLYGDAVIPSRISASGGAVTIQGMGFAAGQTVTVGSVNVVPLDINAGQMILEVPAQPDGTESITITDPVTGSSSVMTNVLTLGASATDNIVLVRGLNPPTPVGTQTVNPITVQVVAADGVTPVAGATIAWSSTNSAALSACGGAFSCSVTSDEVGSASTFIVPNVAGVATITAALAPLSYSSSKSVSATVLGTIAASQIGVATPYLYIAQGASLTVPLTARALSNGVPQSAATVTFNMTTGSGSLSATSATTNSSGYATVNLTLAQFAATVQVNACVPSGPCAPTYANPVALAQQNLQPVAGENQIVALGQAFQPIIVRVTDSSSPPNPVLGASVAFENIVERPEGNSAGNSGQNNPGMPDILSVSQSTALTDFNGLASVEPSAASFNGTLEVDVMATAGIGAMLNYVLEALPEVAETGGSNTGGSSLPPSRGNPVRPPQGWLEK